MSDLPPVISRAEAMLGELASQALEICRDLKDQILAAETGAQAAQLTHAWAAAGRSMRQSLALQSRLGREIRKADREEAVEIARDHAQRLPQRARQVREAGLQMIWNEYEAADDRELHREILDDWISEAGVDHDFTQTPLPRILDKVREILGLDDTDEELLEPADCPSPPVGEGGLRSRSDEGSLKPVGATVGSARSGNRSKTPHPSASPPPSPTRGEGKRRRRSSG